jgi:hypothetical protein
MANSLQPDEVLTNGESILNLLLLRVSRPIPTRAPPHPPHPPHDIILHDIESLRQIIALYKRNKNRNKDLQFFTDKDKDMLALNVLQLNIQRTKLSELNESLKEKYNFGPEALEYLKIMTSMIDMLAECSVNKDQIKKQNKIAVETMDKVCNAMKYFIDSLRDMIASETYDKTSIYRWYNTVILASQFGTFAFENSMETDPDIFNRDYNIFEQQRQREFDERERSILQQGYFSLGGKPRKNKKKSRHRGRRSGRKSRSTSTRSHRSRKY